MIYNDRFTVVIDACVLGAGLKRNLILTLAGTGYFRPRWSARILDEMQKAVQIITNGDNDGSYPRQQIERAFPEAIVTGYEPLEAGLDLPDPNDHHVLAVAIQTGASEIVTDNLKDFPADKLAPYDISALSTDEFIANTLDLEPFASIAALRTMRQNFNNPKMTAEALVHLAEARGLLQTATILQTIEPLL